MADLQEAISRARELKDRATTLDYKARDLMHQALQAFQKAESAWDEVIDAAKDANDANAAAEAKSVRDQMSLRWRKYTGI